MTAPNAAPLAGVNEDNVRPTSNRVSNANKIKPTNKIGGYEK